jgi:hypothetical protein
MVNYPEKPLMHHLPLILCKERTVSLLGPAEIKVGQHLKINLQLNRPVIAGSLMLRAIKLHETNFLEDIWTVENWQKQKI